MIIGSAQFRGKDRIAKDFAAAAKAGSFTSKRHASTTHRKVSSDEAIRPSTKQYLSYFSAWF
jgi:hypothetical protein